MLINFYEKILSYVNECMKNSAHDREHVNRVLYIALDIAQYEAEVDYNVLIPACLLHDIGRQVQYLNPALCHASIGSKMAYEFLINIGFDEERACHIRSCIASHRFRKHSLPESIEARILFDSDKLDGIGAIGIARTLLYIGKVSEPLYTVNEMGDILDGTYDENPSFLQEYKFKIEKLYNSFFTKRAEEICSIRKNFSVLFYDNFLREIKDAQSIGTNILSNILKK